MTKFLIFLLIGISIVIGSLSGLLLARYEAACHKKARDKFFEDHGKVDKLVSLLMKDIDRQIEAERDRALRASAMRKPRSTDTDTDDDLVN